MTEPNCVMEMCYAWFSYDMSPPGHVAFARWM